MYDLRNLREMLCKELDEIADKREMSAGDLDAIQKLSLIHISEPTRPY